MAVLNNLTANGVAAERAGRMIGGVDKAIRGSSGEANALFQEVFGRAGVGGDTVGGRQAAIRSGGLFGADINKNNLSKADAMAFRGIGMGGGQGTGQKVAKSFTDLMNTKFGTDEEAINLMRSGDPKKSGKGRAGRLQKNNFIMNAFGLENEVQAGEVSKMLTELGNGTTEKRKTQIKKRMAELEGGNSELGNLKLINKSTAGTWNVLKAQHRTIQDELGGQIAPAVMSIDKTLMNLDRALSAMLDYLGIKSPEEKVREALSGDKVLTQKDFDQTTMGDPVKEKKFSKDLADEFTKNQERINDLKAGGADKGFKRSGRGVSTTKAYDEWFELSQKNKKISDSFRNVEGMDPTGHMKGGIRGQFNSQTRKRTLEEKKHNESLGGKVDNFWKNLFNGDEYKSSIKRKKEGTNRAEANRSEPLVPILQKILDNNEAQLSTQRKLEQKPIMSVPNKDPGTGN